MLLHQFADALGIYTQVLNRLILDAIHPEIASFDDAINWVTSRQSELNAARQNVERLANGELIAAVVPPEGTNSDQWTVQLLAMVTESYNAISYVFTSGPPQTTSSDPRAAMAASVVSQQLETSSKLIRELDSRRRFLDAAVLTRQSSEVPDFIIQRARDSAAVFSGDEVATWPPGLLNGMLSRGVLRPDENAKSVSCDGCGHDHVEVVQFVESPPGSGLRAYISCPELGRVPVSLSRLRRWTVELNVIEVPAAGTTAPDEDNRVETNESLSDEYFKDEDGTWLVARVLAERLGIPDSRLKQWRESNCPSLGGRRLAARQVSGIGWVYFRLDVNEIANRRADKGNIGDVLNIQGRLEAASILKRQRTTDEDDDDSR